MLALFPALVLPGRVLFERDVAIVWQPQVESFVRAVTGGSWPLWDPLVSFGHPMLANPNTQVLYPFTWLNLVLGPGPFYTVYALAHLMAAALGVFFLARRLRLSIGAAFLAAAVYTASGPLLSLVNVWHHLAGAALLPWVCLTAERALASGRIRHAVAWGLVLGLQVLAGSPDLTLLSGIVVALWTLADLVGPGGRGRRGRVAITASVALLVALTISAAQWLPALAAAAGSARQALEVGQRIPSSVRPLGLLETLSAVPWTDLPISAGVRDALYDGAAPFVHSLYLGAPALLLAALGLVGARRPRRALLALVAASFTLLGLGPFTPLYGLALAALPILRSIRYPSKALVVAAFAIALLAGMGIDRWRESGRRARTWLALGLALLGLAELAAAGVLFRPRPLLAGFLLDEATLAAPWGEALRPMGMRLALAGALWLAIASIAAWLAFRKRGGADPRGARAFVIALVVVDLWAAGRFVNPTAPRDIFRYRPPLVDAVPPGARVFVYRYPLRPAPPHAALATDNPYRIAWFPPGYDVHSGQILAARLYPMPPVGAAYGLRGSYDPDLLGLYPSGLAQLVSAMEASEGTPAYARFLRLGAVTHVAALHTRGFEALVPERELATPFVLPVRVFGVRDALPRAYVVGRGRLADGEAALATLVDPAFDPGREVVLAPGSPLLSGNVAGDEPPGASRILTAGVDHVRVEARLRSPGYLVLVDTYDPGWKVEVDGQPARLLRANVAFRAVVVGPGRHLVDFRYRPRSVTAGLVLSGVGLLIALGLASMDRHRGRTGGTPGDGPAE